MQTCTFFLAITHTQQTQENLYMYIKSTIYEAFILRQCRMCQSNIRSFRRAFDFNVIGKVETQYNPWYILRVARTEYTQLEICNATQQT